MESPWLVLYAGDNRAYQSIADAIARARTEGYRTERIVAVVHEQFEPWWSGGVTALPDENVVPFRLDRGSGNGVLAALAAILADGETPPVVIAPIGTTLLPRRAPGPERPCRVWRTARGPIVAGAGKQLMSRFVDAEREGTRALLETRGDRSAIDAIFPQLPWTSLDEVFLGDPHAA